MESEDIAVYIAESARPVFSKSVAREDMTRIDAPRLTTRKRCLQTPLISPNTV